MAICSVNTKLHEHTHTVPGIKDLVLAQDVHVLALKKLVQGEGISQEIFPEDVRTFARNYFKQKKELLFLNSNGVLCVKYPLSQRPLHERPCMIVMPQLYQHEILFRAHDAMGHQGISKAVARIQERQTWPGIRRTVGEYVRQCLTCQQVRGKPGDVRFHLKNIQSRYLNEQNGHMKLSPTDDGNTGILVIIDHISNFTKTIPCSHNEYDAITTSRLLLQKWFARHGTPTRMQSDNAPNLTAEVSNEFTKASQVTKVTSTAGHLRTLGLVERQNRTLLTLLRVFCSRRMRDGDQHLDEVLGAYISTRHATTGFSPYMLTRGLEKAIPLTYLYPEFATQSFPTHDAYVDHVLARQQEFHDLVRRNTHQAQLRQKLKYDRAIRAKAYAVGVFCRYVPQKGSTKLMRAWCGPHRVVHTLQDGRVYILDTGQKVHFERLKPHNSGPLEFVATPLDTGDVALVMDPEPEHSIEPIKDDCSILSFKSEQLLSEASNASLPSRQRHWMDTRLHTKLRAGGTRQHYQQFDYSTSDTDEETHDEMFPIPTYSPQQVHTQPHPEAITDLSAPDFLSDVSMFSCLPQLFSDHEPMRSPSPHISQSSKTPELSPTGTSAPLLTQPSLTDYLSNYPLWLNHAKDSTAPSSRPSSPSESIPSAKSPQPPPTAHSIKRGRGRPRKKTHQQKTKGKTVPKAQKLKPDTQTESQNRYQLRHRRQPRYKCGTCGLRDCVCVLAMNEKRDVPTGARGAPRRDGNIPN